MRWPTRSPPVPEPGGGPRAGFLRIAGKGEDDDVPAAVREAFPDAWLAPWLRARRKIEGAGYGTALEAGFRTAGPACARLVGPEPAIDMADFLSAVTIKAGRRAGERLCAVAPAVAERLGDGPRFRSWLSLMQRFAAMAPESVLPVLERLEALMERVNLAGLEAWLLAGVRIAGADRERRAAFFRFESPDAERLLDREAGETGFFDVERRMKAFMGALYGSRAPIREAPPGRHDGAQRRAGFGDGIIRMPSSFPGFRGDHAEALYRASLAHIAAHMRHGGPRFPVGKLKPLQIAVVSLIEDARVEALAMRDMPGLRRLWLQFHIAQSSGALTAPSLFARLSRALIDPEFEDIDGWVRKGRDMFHAAEGQLEDAGISRAIGNLLGNDLGQMRVQFNAKTYAVQPPYRDDNAGIWEPDPDMEPPEDAEAVVVESVRLRQTEQDDTDREREGDTPPDDTQRARSAAAPDPEAGVPVASYPEYDYQAGVERPDWTTVVEYPPRLGDPRFATEVLERHADVAGRIAALVRAARVGRPVRLRRQAEGETLDLDACIDALAAVRAGDMPDPRVYRIMARRSRDLAVAVLLDISQSTADPVPGGGTVLDLEREAVVLLSEAMGGLGDPFSIAAFSSNGRDEVRYHRIKDFGEKAGPVVGASLAGLKSGYSTRLGAALRHAGADLAGQPSFRRLILLVSDGEPSDIDCPDPAYLVEDARRAVHRLSQQGIDVFCVGLGARNAEQEARIFGQRGFVQIERIAALTEKLPALYLRLTA
ncbi:MAG: VWA domain-containing protein [Pseudomonadota bacterium]